MKKLKLFIGVFSILSVISTGNKLYAYNEIQGIFKPGNQENKNIPDNSQSRSENVQTPQVEIVVDPMWEYYIEYHERIDAETSSLNQNRINHSISPLDNPSAIKEQRRSIARLNTELRQRELNDNKV